MSTTPFEFTGTLIEGPDIDLTSIAELDLSDDQLDTLWSWTNSRDLLLSCPCVEEFCEEEIDDNPEASDSYYRYVAASKAVLRDELQEAISKILDERSA